MEFIRRSACPSLLAKNQRQWTQPWLDHYQWQGDKNNRPPLPTRCYWRNAAIRQLLIDDFHRCCGYCGSITPTPEDTEDSGMTFLPIGDVDHYWPKSIMPAQTYEWTNYVWCCKPCNRLKSTFYDQQYPLFHPCNQIDCDQLLVNPSTGRYQLVDAVKTDPFWRKRLHHTEQKTLLNVSANSNNRRDMITAIKTYFRTIDNNLTMVEQWQLMSDNQDVIEPLRQMIAQNITDIQQWRDNGDFYLLRQKTFSQLAQKYTEVSALLADPAL